MTSMIVLVFMLAASTASSESAPPPAAQAAFTLVDIHAAADALSLVARKAAAEAHGSSRDARSRIIAAAVEESFAPARFRESSARAFRERSAALPWSELVVALSSPLVRKMERVERETRTIESLDAYRAFLHTSPPTPERRALVERLDRATGTSELAVDVQAVLSEAILSGINQSLPFERRMAPGDIEAAVEAARSELEEEARGELRLTFLLTYRESSDAELRGYVEFLESENGRSLSRAIVDSLRVALDDAAGRLRQAISDRARELGRTRI
jgi:hypothetical protein